MSLKNDHPVVLIRVRFFVVVPEPTSTVERTGHSCIDCGVVTVCDAEMMFTWWCSWPCHPMDAVDVMCLRMKGFGVSGGTCTVLHCGRRTVVVGLMGIASS